MKSTKHNTDSSLYYFREKINDKLDVSNVLDRFKIDYKIIGDEYKILCPFHGERTASFFISSTKKAFHCFGCHQSGDLVRFIAKITKQTVYSVIVEYTKLFNIEYPKALNEIHNNKIEQFEFTEKQFIGFQLDILYSVRDHLKTVMIEFDPFSDIAVEYYKTVTEINRLEYCLDCV